MLNNRHKLLTEEELTPLAMRGGRRGFLNGTPEYKPNPNKFWPTDHDTRQCRFTEEPKVDFS